MKTAPLFSLIIATVNRPEKIVLLLNSLVRQNYSDFEVIIVDQSTNDFTEKVVNLFSCLTIKYFRVPKQGLSYARNFGINFAVGKIFAFPDDDCIYYTNTLMEVKKAFDENPDYKVIVGRICDDRGKNIIRNWPSKTRNLNKYNFFFLYSSVTLFSTSRQRFDEDFGVGAKYGSCEDADYIYRLIKGRNQCIFVPNIRIYHPELKTSAMSEAKSYNYGLGFGGLWRKHFSFAISLFAVANMVFHFANFSVASLTNNKSKAARHKAALIGRLRGFISYSRSM